MTKLHCCIIMSPGCNFPVSSDEEEKDVRTV